MPDPLAERSVIVVCTDIGIESCWNCGGWTRAEGGPSLADDHFCSDDCYEESLIFAERNKRVDDWCPSCGFDNFEHAEDCERAASGTSANAGGGDTTPVSEWPERTS